jgi:phage terminase large subunit-like protein
VSTPSIPSDESDDGREIEVGLPPDWRDLSPEAKKVLLHKLRGRHVSLGLGGPREWRKLARPKQLAPNDPGHWLPDENGFACGCEQGPDEGWNIWMFMAGRGCVAGETLVYLPLEDRHERIDVLARAGKPITVLSLTNNGARPAQTDGAPFIRGMDQLYRVATDGGQAVTVTSRHRFLTPQGWRLLADVRVGQLLAAGAPVPPGEGSSSLSGSPGDARHWKNTAADSRYDYPRYHHYDGQPPRLEAGSGRGNAPSSDGAAGRSRMMSHADDRGLSRECSHPRLQNTLRARNSYAPGEPSLPVEVGLAPLVADELSPPYSPASRLSHGTSAAASGNSAGAPRQGKIGATLTSVSGLQAFSGDREAEFQLSGERVLLSDRRHRLFPLDPSNSPQPDSVLSTGGEAQEGSGSDLAAAYANSTIWTRVTAIAPTGTGLFYDMTVPGAENYAAEGLWNHNCGKTWAGANWIIEQALRDPGSVWAVVAPTFRDVRVTCFEGPSGIRRLLEPGEEAQWRRNELRLDLVNGSILYGYSADQPERLRGSNLSGAWCDEMGSWQYEETWYEGLVPALRIGTHPRVMITSTPRPTHLIRDLYNRRDGTMHATSASTWENAKNLSAAALDELRRRYEGTRLGRQELEGELLADLEGALWKRSDIDAARVRLADVPDLVRVVVGIDPAVTSTEESDETGIIVAGDDGHGHGYVLGDYSMKGTPEQCMREAVRAYKRHGADCIVAEVNNGGDFIGTVLRAVDPEVPYRTVRASRGKALRAEPVSALAEQRRLHHVGSFAELEDQLCSYVPGIGASPDRMDALVWAVFELRGLSQASWLSAYGVARCPGCDHAYSVGLKECPRCRTENPLEAERTASAEGSSAVTEEPQPGGWASVYRIRRCEKGHAYSDRNGNGGSCPRCRSGGLDFLRSSGKNLTSGGGSGMIRM